MWMFKLEFLFGFVNLQMSLVTDSPVHSSSSDDFAALLDAELEIGSSGSSPDEQDDEDEKADADNDDDLDSRRYVF